MSLPSDPFAAIHDAVWARLVRHPVFAELVLPGNRIKYSGTDNENPDKTNPSDGDMPAVRVVLSGGSLDLFNNSEYSVVSQRVNIEIDTMDKRIAANFGKVKWAVICSLESLGDLRATLDYVTAVNSESHADTLVSNRQSVEGWTCVLSLRFDLNFSRAEMALASAPA